VTAPVAVGAGSAPAPEWVTSVERQSTLVGGGPPAPEWTPPPVRALPPVTLTAPRTTSSETTPQEVTVHRGDTLWDLAAAHLSADAGDAEIAEAWQRWWALNRDVIGADPDLILPGQVLLVPEPSR
jgi:nucleoid-associated protein YgaU